ncbi:Gfo/Idh/MocA family protein [Arthrobacter sp. 35W]|uniref:Gfo/Idh/MocA family protein n=1 Tax=Arthrobacter sp. 35W TaxID=1132441 RepID=UPI0003FB6875|nr:Gfo/Idh/MocA family oxidoreductase [Arthrobacter sp. 35W]
MTEPRYIAKPDWYTTDNPETLAATGTALRWGVVATGGIAGTVTADLALLEDAVLQAVSSRTEPKAADFAARFGFASHYFDGGADGLGPAGYEQLVQDPAVDVVYIATPHAQHYRVAKAALEAGKHVLCEKALTINAAETKVLIELARERGLFLMEAVWARFVPGIQRALSVIASGEIGTVKWVRADLGFPAPLDLSARIWNPSDGGGALLDVTVYPLLWAWGALGAPSRVQATGTITDFGVDSQNALTLEYDGGAQAQLMSYLTSHGPRAAVVAGTKGMIESVKSVNNPRTIRISTGWDTQREESFDIPGSGYTYQLREVTRCIQSGLLESPTMPLSDSLAIMELFDDVRAQLGVVYPNDQAPPA